MAHILLLPVSVGLLSWTRGAFSSGEAIDVNRNYLLAHFCCEKLLLKVAVIILLDTRDT